MTDSSIQAELRAGADGLCALEAGTRPHSTQASFPVPAGRVRMLRLAASLAGDIPVRLVDAVTGIDGRNMSLLV